MRPTKKVVAKCTIITILMLIILSLHLKKKRRKHYFEDKKRCYTFREDKNISLPHSERRWLSPDFIRKTMKKKMVLVALVSSIVIETT